MALNKRKCLAWLMKTCLFGLIVISESAYADDQEPYANLLCISECNTCPVICSSPPPPSESRSPPKKYYPPPPPRQTYYDSPPVQPRPSSSPPPPPKKSPPKSAAPPPPPVWYFVGGSPPAPYNSDVPPSGPGVTVVSPSSHDKPYPFYYFYASDASSFSVQFSSFFFVLFLVQFVLSG